MVSTLFSMPECERRVCHGILEEQLGARQEIVMLCDGNGDFEKLGMLVNKRDLGFGLRSWRYAMHVQNLVVQKYFAKTKTHRVTLEVSDAQTMVKYLTTG